MSGTEFEEYVKELLERQGWRVETTPPTRDGGIDLIAKRSVDMGTESTLYIQCKNYSDSRKTCMLLKIGDLSIPAFVNITPIKSTTYAF